MASAWQSNEGQTRACCCRLLTHSCCFESLKSQYRPTTVSHNATRSTWFWWSRQLYRKAATRTGSHGTSKNRRVTTLSTAWFTEVHRLRAKLLGCIGEHDCSWVNAHDSWLICCTMASLVNMVLLSSSLELKTYVGCWGHWFLPTSSCPMLGVPLAMYNRASPLYHRPLWVYLTSITFRHSQHHYLLNN